MQMIQPDPPDQAGLTFADAQVVALLRHISDTYPDLAVRAARVEPAGQRSSTLVINDTLVFRFPRTQADVDALGIEASILRAIRNKLPLPTPDLAYENLGIRAVGTTFLGYPRLPGEPLWPNTLIDLGEARRLAVASQLALFLRELHSVPASALPIDLPLRDDYAHWSELYGRIRDKLFPLMPAEKCAIVARHFERYLDEWDRTSYQPVLRHGDFGPSNILRRCQLAQHHRHCRFRQRRAGRSRIGHRGCHGTFRVWGGVCALVHQLATRSVETFLPRARF